MHGTNLRIGFGIPRRYAPFVVQFVTRDLSLFLLYVFVCFSYSLRVTSLYNSVAQEEYSSPDKSVSSSIQSPMLFTRSPSKLYCNNVLPATRRKHF
jgi:hypothetical protein